MKPASAMIRDPTCSARGSAKAQRHVKTRNHSTSDSHVPSFTSGSLSTAGAKEVAAGQKGRAEPFFPTITRSFGNRNGSQKRLQTRDTEEEQGSSCPRCPR